MCSLQMQAEAGPTMLEAPELVEGAVERFVTKQARRWVVHQQTGCRSCLPSSLTTLLVSLCIRLYGTVIAFRS